MYGITPEMNKALWWNSSSGLGKPGNCDANPESTDFPITERLYNTTLLESEFLNLKGNFMTNIDFSRGYSKFKISWEYKN